MSIKSIFQTAAFILYELIVLVALVAAIRWLSDAHTAPAIRGLVFLAAMGLFIPPLMYVIYRPYRTPTWLAAVQQQGQAAQAEVVTNGEIGSYWRLQDMGRFVQITVRVTPDGQAAFETRLTCQLDEAQRLPAGAKIMVRFDPLARNHTVLNRLTVDTKS